MFQAFIQERLLYDAEGAHAVRKIWFLRNILDNKSYFLVFVDLFTRRAMEHSDEMEKNTALLLKNYKVVNKKVKTFGDKIKDLTIFTK